MLLLIRPSIHLAMGASERKHVLYRSEMRLKRLRSCHRKVTIWTAMCQTRPNHTHVLNDPYVFFEIIRR